MAPGAKHPFLCSRQCDFWHCVSQYATRLQRVHPFVAFLPQLPHGFDWVVVIFFLWLSTRIPALATYGQNTVSSHGIFLATRERQQYTLTWPKYAPMSYIDKVHTMTPIWDTKCPHQKKKIELSKTEGSIPSHHLKCFTNKLHRKTSLESSLWSPYENFML